MIGRREFITLLGGAVAAWPVAARAQQSERMRRIGVLMNMTADDPESQARLSAFVQGLQEFGWTVGRNVRIDYRWGEGDAERYRRQATELFALEPDVILSWGAEIARGRKRPAASCPSCLRNPSTRLAPAWSRAWRGQAATPPVSPSLNTV